jgi:RNA polymerase sigma-70 factor (ECF subfamily)
LVRRRRPEAISVDEDIQTEDGDMEPVQIVDWCCLPENELLSAEGKRFLDSAIQRLPATLKVVFILRDIEGLSIKETADTLNLSETAVKTRLLRARLNLREQLSIYYTDKVVEAHRP